MLSLQTKMFNEYLQHLHHNMGENNHNESHIRLIVEMADLKSELLAAHTIADWNFHKEFMVAHDCHNLLFRVKICPAILRLWDDLHQS